MTTWKHWTDDLVKRVADAMKSIRVADALSAANLATRTGVGKPLTRAVISDLETYRKKTLDLSELLTLAAALDVSPLSLLLPNVLEDVEMLPGKRITGIEALAWLLGVGGDVPGIVGVFNCGDRSLQLAVKIVEVDNLLKIQRYNASQHERGLELANADILSDQMKAYEQSNLEHSRSQIKLLENQRRELVHHYTREVAGRSGG